MDVLKRIPVREQDAKERATNFKEVCLGYNKEEAMEEASRCINCKNAQCVKGCPVAIQIPQFIEQVKNGNIEEAYRIISESSALPAVCGRVCPQESQCEGKCIRGFKGDPISIGKLERFVADWARENGIKPTPAAQKNGKKVAVIGSGPAGLTCAGDLARLGYQVTVFEAFQVAGGVLMYGIPEFRLPKTIVQQEIQSLKDAGVDIQPDMVIGKILSIDELMAGGYDAVFIGSGAGLPRFMNIPGEGLVGVCSANEYLTRINLMKAYREDSDTPIMDLKGKTVAVSGAGNVATYAIEKAWQLGAKPVTCSDSTGWIYDPEGIDVALLQEVKEVKRARLTEYAAARPSAQYHEKKNGEHGVWTVKCDVALPCATQNELDLEDAKQLVANGVFAVAEGANMPTTMEATEYFQKNGVLFCPGKASNAGGVATSALEMSQNSERLSWTFEEVDAKLKTIMVNIFHNLDDAAKKYGMEGNYVAGANIAGFLKVADAMTAQGIV